MTKARITFDLDLSAIPELAAHDVHVELIEWWVFQNLIRPATTAALKANSDLDYEPDGDGPEQATKAEQFSRNTEFIKVTMNAKATMSAEILPPNTVISTKGPLTIPRTINNVVPFEREHT